MAPRWIALVLACGLLAAAGAAAEPAAGPEIVVKLRADGPRAVRDCAEARWRRGEPLAGATRDGSDSLDRLQAELGVRRVRALFRRHDGRPFAAQRAALRRRWAQRAPAGAAPPDLAHVYTLALEPGQDAAAAAARWAADPHVEWAQPNLDLELDATANDPFFASSGSWGQPYLDLWGLHRVNAPLAWDTARGEGVVVAVIDSGIDTGHPDLAANLWVNPGEDLDGDGVADPEEFDGVDDDANGFVDDLHGYDFANDDPDPFDDRGHGSHVSGTLAAVADNGAGIAGVAPRARILSIKAFAATGGAPADRLARAIVYAVGSGARVINNSWSCGVRCPSNPLLEEATALAASQGVVVVTSAGNRADDVQFYSPENRRETIVVGASYETDVLARFSSRGVLVDVLAPGAGDPLGSGFHPRLGILSARSAGTPGDPDADPFVLEREWVRLAGTSMSAPHVAGVAALLLSARPDLTADDVRGVLRASAFDLGAPGHDGLHGAGLADAEAALRTPIPGVAGRLLAPGPGAVVVPREDEVIVRAAFDGDVAGATLGYGAGRDPVAFTPIPLSPGALDSGELARWDVRGVADGAYVLRLEVGGADGSAVVEFLPLSLERNVPRRLSSPGPDALAPSISGRRVAWESRRERDGEDLGREVFVSDWRSGEEVRAVSAAGDQRAPVISGRHLVWRDARDFAEEIRSCRLARRDARCRDAVVAGGPGLRLGVDASGPRVVWTEAVPGGALELRACTRRGGACRAFDLPSGPRQTSPSLDRLGLWWLDQSTFPFQLFRCLQNDLKRESCAPQRVVAPRLQLYAASGSLLAWTDGSPFLAPLFACRVQPDGACKRVRFADVENRDGDPGLVVSGRRIAWWAAGPGGDADVFFCEFDARTASCPVQRVTGSAAEQRRPDLSGRRLVWEDDRDGAFAIYGIELPSLAPLADRTARSGRPLAIAVRGRAGSADGLALSAAFVDGTPLEARGARFDDRGEGRGRFDWTPGEADVGEHLVRFEALTPGGLHSARSVRIVVEPAH